jgi:hypothetical protein
MCEIYYILCSACNVLGTDEQYVLYCIEIPYQKLGLYWYWQSWKKLHALHAAREEELQGF